MKDTLLQKIKYSKPVVGIYSKLMTNVQQKMVATDIPEVRKLMCRKAEGELSGLRLNLMVPSVSRQDVFGGIATALSFFQEFVKQLDCDSRIVTVDRVMDEKELVELPGYRIVPAGRHSEEPNQLVDMTIRSNQTLEVDEQDLFMVTSWWTAYMTEGIIKWQAEQYKMAAKPIVYFIQDYEPGFYAWSSKYVMAESTYKMDIPVYAVFNSKLLYDYVEELGYQFEKKWYFEPTLNKELKNYLTNLQEYPERKNQILLYGRPGTPRNAFELIMESLREWSDRYPQARKWSVLAAGEEFDDIDLGNGVKVISVGKLSLEGYANVMLESKVGISLMVSPHPSYPPLEMATFGVKVITNKFGNKDLSSFNDNVLSVDSCSAGKIAESLIGACEKPNNHIVMGTGYCDSLEEWSQIISQLCLLFK